MIYEGFLKRRLWLYLSGFKGIKAKMQCTSYSPELYSRRDINGVPNGGQYWPVYGNYIAQNMSGQSSNNFYPSPNADQIRVVYHNDVLRQTMLRHENIFREQVRELHRLHRRQRELMNGFNRRALKEPNIVSISHHNFIVSKVSSDCASITRQTPMVPTLTWITPPSNKLSTPGCKNSLLTFSSLDTSSENKNGFESNEVLPPKCKKTKRKMLDLELPADEYVDSEEEKGYEVHSNGSRCSSDRNVNLMDFDLNMPPTLSQESNFQTNMEIKVGARPEYDNDPNKECIKSHNGVVFETKSKINLFDLNSCVDPLSTITISKTVEIVPDVDLKAPVSPENMESSPPRGNSEENHLEPRVKVSKQEEDSDPNDNLVSTAAATIFLISKSGFNEKSKASFVESLDWFAGVVVSSIASDESEKEESECVVALPSQHGKRHRKRRMNRKVFEREVFRSVSTLTTDDMSFGQNGLKSWGKVNKRPRGSRVQASSIRLAWR